MVCIGQTGAVDLPDGEPDCGPWRPVPVADLHAVLGRPRVLAVDGRSGSGKSTLVARLAATVPSTAVVHTDDVAWHHDFFDWADLLLDGVLVPWRAGRDVAYRPPPWDARGRAGAITVPAAAPLLVVEGVGAGRRAFAPQVDALIWVQTDRALATRRGLERDGGDVAFWDEWEARERPFLAADRPWARADLVVSGQDVRHDLVEVGRGVPDLPAELRRLQR
jgi:energy-coupling factor transporter ATP-binding protein EcfA2